MSEIVLVEDGLITAFHLKKLLEENGCEVIAHLASGEQVFDCVKNTNPDLVILDIMLEGKMNGIEVAHELRRISDVPILFMSALSDVKTLHEITLISNSAKLSKPVEEDSLLKEIAMLLKK